MLNKIPILKSLLDYYEEGVVPFHMPGHKKGNLYSKIGFDLFDTSMLTLDVTEIPGIDNLHCPEDAIKEAQRLAAKAFGADYTFFLVNGTTCGIYSMIMAATNPGDKIIVPRNCHKSVAGAVILGRLKPVYINPSIDSKLRAAMGITPQEIEAIIMQHPDAKTVVITNPTFYGACSDIEGIAKAVHKHNMLLLVDEAHGAHFKFHSRLPVSAMKAGADAAAQSTHKTLAAMTQASMLHVKSERIDIDKLKFFLQLNQTTSPSHIMLATLDITRYIMEETGKELLDASISSSNWARDEINCIKGVYCLGRDRIGKYGIYDIDDTRLTINFSNLGVGGTEIEHLLRKSFKIQVEMSDLYNIVAIASIGDDAKSYEKLVYALSMLAAKAKHSEDLNDSFSNRLYLKEIAPVQAMLPWEAVYGEKEYISIENSIGRICGEMLIPYPPGIPVIMPGELITEEVLDYIAECMDKGIKINGPSDATLEKIAVIKRQISA
ncbi:MAG: aminotransferase class I/II-fold pyridoxal phosphate-dependent enzyme [Bacillota bacterium]